MNKNNKLLFDIEKNSLAIKSLISQKKNINNCIDLIHKSICRGGKILLCGNGGSAADAQHLAAEFLVRLKPNLNRKPIAAISLLTDVSTITACGNDYNFTEIFVRPFEALAGTNDILLAISTSGNSKNILKVLKSAKKKNVKRLCFLGGDGGKAKDLCDISIITRSNITARIQESHIFIGHHIFESVESLILKK